MRFSRCGILLIALGVVLGHGHALAGPPKTSDPSPFVQWLAPLNPAGWEMPDLSWPGQEKKSKPVLRRKSDGIWSSMTGAVGQGWQATKRTLDPKQWGVPGGQSRASQSRAPEKGSSFWSSLWPKREESKKIKTANDFLSQPVPY